MKKPMDHSPSVKDYENLIFRVAPAVLTDLLALVKGVLEIEGLGFERQRQDKLDRERIADEQEMPGWEETVYVRPADGTLPKLVLHLNENIRLGTNIAINSFPAEPRFHFHSGSPMSPDKVVPKIKEYLEAKTRQYV
jgi:hypothetical protein